MRKMVGPLLKALAYLVLLAAIGAIIFIASQSSPLGIFGAYQAYLLIGLGLAGFLLFLLLYAQGQSVQALVEIAESQAQASSALREISGLSQERPAGPAYEPRTLFAPEPAPAQPANGWRRRASAGEAGVPAAHAPRPKVACSLCGTVQDAGQPSCLQCGATFVTGASQ